MTWSLLRRSRRAPERGKGSRAALPSARRIAGGRRTDWVGSWDIERPRPDAEAAAGHAALPEQIHATRRSGGLASASGAGHPGGMPTDDARYRNAAWPAEDRVEDLLARMTLDEKLAQLGCVWSTELAESDAFSERRARERLAHGIGQITRIGASTGLRPRESAAFANRIQRFLAEETRLGIPAIVHEESTAGFCARDADQFPQAIGLAATFDPELVERMGRGDPRADARGRRAPHARAGARRGARPALGPRRGDLRRGPVPRVADRRRLRARRAGRRPRRRASPRPASTSSATALSEGGLNHAPVHLGPRELREVYAAPFGAAIREAGLAS